MKTIRVARSVSAALSLAAIVGCAAPRRSMDVRGGRMQFPERSAVIFFVDGLSRSVLDDMLADEQLPSIQQWFVERGVLVDGTVSSLPPLTYANATSILTGLLPGHHGILGHQWFDRYELLLRDYGSAATYRQVNEDIAAPTVYDILSDHFTVSVQNHTRRGVTVSIDHALVSGVNWLTHRFSDVDRRVGKCMDGIHALAERGARWPILLMNYFPGVDEIGHHFGPDSPQYRAAIRVADRAIGEVIAAHSKAGLLDRTYFVLLTDHGMVLTTPERSIALNDWLEQHFDWRLFSSRIDPNQSVRNLARLEGYDAVVINSAWRMVSVHLPGPCGWPCRPTADALTRILLASGDDPNGEGSLIDLDAVALACLPLGPDAVRVISKTGRVRVERRVRADRKEYRLIPDEPPATDEISEANDPLAYVSDPRLASFVASGWHTSRDWLAATRTTRFPDFVPQVVEMFDSPRAGDLIVFAAEGWSFATGALGGHGSCLAEDMVIPLYVAGPNLPHGGRIHNARLVDVMPTVIDLLGHQGRLEWLEQLDGESFADRLKTATTSDCTTEASP